MKFTDYQGILFIEGGKQPVQDKLAVEAPLKVLINNVAFTITMRMPGEDKELIQGLLLSEGVVKKNSVLNTIIFSEESNLTIASLTIPKEELDTGYLNSRTLLSVASCGICGKTQLESFSKKEQLHGNQEVLPVQNLCDMFKKMHKNQRVFNQTGGTHAAAIFSLDGKLLSLYEDIGRHNAVDKAVGNLILTENLDRAKVLTVSGRISYEIVIKCFKAGIPFLAAVSSPSTLAIDFAKELGITLLAFCREEKATCYSFPETIN